MEDMIKNYDVGEIYYTVTEIAEILKLHPNTIQTWIKNKKMPGFKIHSKYRIPKSDFDKWLEDSKNA